MTGTRIMDPGGANTTTSTVGSFASLRSSTVNSLTPASGTASVKIEGVVAGSSWQTQWGVATTTPTYTPSGGSPTTIPATTGPVTIDPSGTLTTQSVGTIANAGSTPDTISRNLISVPASSGQVVYGYAQTASGAFNQTAISDGSGKTVTANLTGTSTGFLAGNTSANLNLTSTAMNPGSYTSGSGNMAINSVGVLAGQPGGVQTGVSTHHGVRTINGTTRMPVYVGSTTLTPASGSTPATLATNLYGVNRTSWRRRRPGGDPDGDSSKVIRRFAEPGTGRIRGQPKSCGCKGEVHVEGGYSSPGAARSPAGVDGLRRRRSGFPYRIPGRLSG